jgi:hypothetical protein
MDIHKPKAAHSWREFLVEIGTIICGILIALGLEQAIEWLHVRGEVTETREALHREIEANAQTLTFMLAEDQCLDHQLDRYATWAAGGRHAEAMRVVLPHVLTSTWEQVRSGAVTRMPLKERLELAAYYDGLRNLSLTIVDQRAALRPLAGFQVKAQLTPAAAERLLEVIAEGRILGQAKSVNIRPILRASERLGVKPGALSADWKARADWECSAPSLGGPSGQVPPA